MKLHVHSQSHYAPAVSLSATASIPTAAAMGYLRTYDALFSNAPSVAPRDGGILAAASYQPANWIVLDAGPDFGLVHSIRVASAFVGVTVIFLDLWDTERERAQRR